MHELSIAERLIEIASEHADNAGALRVRSITVRIGRLSSVHHDALRFGFEIASEGTPLQGAALRIVDVPVTMHCAVCEREFELPGLQPFRCPRCDSPSGDMRSGDELDIDTMEVETDDRATHSPSSHEDPEEKR